MGCASGKPQSNSLKAIPCSQRSEEKSKNSSSSSNSSINECDTQDLSVNRITILEQSCVGMKIQLQNDYNLVQKQCLSADKDGKEHAKLQEKADVIKLLINLADEIQERSYQLFDKDLKDEPKVEEYLISLIWSCKKLKFKYLNDFLLKIKPLFHAEELNMKKANIHLKKLITKIN